MENTCAQFDGLELTDDELEREFLESGLPTTMPKSVVDQAQRMRDEWEYRTDCVDGHIGFRHLPFETARALIAAVKDAGIDRYGNRRDTPDVYVKRLRMYFGRRGDGRLWYYTGTHWQPCDEEDAISAASHLIEACGGSQKDPRKARDLCQMLLALVSKVPDAETGINTANGLLVPEGDTWTLLPHRPGDGQLSCLPYRYDPHADCPRWRQFLAEVQPDPAVQQFLQELVGYILLGVARPRAEAFFVFIGIGRNGKSVFLETTRAVVGEAACAALSMHQFTNRNMEQLVGKLVNVGSETEDSQPMPTALFKQAVSGELILAEPKYRSHYTFRNTAALLFAVNGLPSITDKSDGIWRRVKIVPWPRVIDNPDPDLIQKLLTELPGILNWALAGAIAVLRRGRLIDPPQVTEAVAKARTENNSVALFLAECAEHGGADQTHRISKGDAYAAYQIWCEGSYRPLARHNFGREISRLLQCKDDLKVSALYTDIHGFTIRNRPDAYPFSIPAGKVLRIVNSDDGHATRTKAAVGMVTRSDSDGGR